MNKTITLDGAYEMFIDYDCKRATFGYFVDWLKAHGYSII
jgi:hypothetical protein